MYTASTMTNNTSNKETNIVWTNDQPAMINLQSIKRDALKPIHFAAYSVGHFSNDLVAGLGFTY